MNETTISKSTLAPRDTRPPAPSPEAAELLAVGRRHLWSFQVLGQAPMLQESVRLGDWLLVPAQRDSTPLPPRAVARIAAIFASGARPQGFVLVHESPMLLKAPREAPQQPKVAAVPAGSTGGDVLSALGSALTAIVTTILPMFFLAAAAIVDPILVAVTEDNYWIEIDRWDTE